MLHQKRWLRNRFQYHLQVVKGRWGVTQALPYITLLHINTVMLVHSGSVSDDVPRLFALISSNYVSNNVLMWHYIYKAPVTLPLHERLRSQELIKLRFCHCIHYSFCTSLRCLPNASIVTRPSNSARHQNARLLEEQS